MPTCWGATIYACDVHNAPRLVSRFRRGEKPQAPQGFSRGCAPTVPRDSPCAPPSGAPATALWSADECTRGAVVTPAVPAVVIGVPCDVPIGPGQRFLQVAAQQDQDGHVTVVLRDRAGPLLELQPLRAQELAFAIERVVAGLGVRR